MKTSLKLLWGDVIVSLASATACVPVFGILAGVASAVAGLGFAGALYVRRQRGR